MEKLAEIVASIIFLMITSMFYLAYWALLAILVIWVVRGISGIDLSDSFFYVVIGIITYKALQAPITMEVKYEPKRKNF